MSSIRFALYGGPTAPVQHLVLLIRQRPCMHWVLPATTGRQPTGTLERGLLLEAADIQDLPALVAQGSCHHAFGPLPCTSSGLQAALATGRLLLTFSGAGLQGTYSLIRLHTNSPAWLLSPVTYLTGRRQTTTAASVGHLAVSRSSVAKA